MLLAHDLRGPLGVASNMSNALAHELANERLAGAAGGISKILMQSINLITDLIEREFIETINVALVKKSIDIVTKINEYFTECKASEEITKRKFEFTSSHKSIFIDLDESKFMQVINNLMTNALKFTEDGGKISCHVEDCGHSVLFTFSDNGVGIPEELHTFLFDKFTDARRPGLHGEPSIGLGLSIVKVILDWHAGSIRVESAEDAGTKFIFEIPKSSV
jgi:two-component system sensor histidine kinase VicK